MKGKILKRCLLIYLMTALCVTGIQLQLPEKAEAAARPSVTVSKRAKTSAVITIKKVKKATGYQVFLAASRGGKYQHIGSTLSGKFTISKIKKNKVYYIKVRAYKTVGYRISTGKYSAVVKLQKYSAESTADKYAKEVVSLVNAERAKEELAELKMSTALNAVAVTRAKELATEFAHVRPDGRDCFTALTDAGIVYTSVGENIAEGQTTPKEVMESWMNSEGHRQNIMSADYTQMGVGYYKKAGQCYWVQIFMKA